MMRRYFYINIVIAAMVAAIVLGLYFIKPFFLERVELGTYDLRFRLRGPLLPNDDIVIVAIDEKSIEALGRFPWSRKYYAAMLDVARQAGVKAVLFDIFFPEGETAEADQMFADALRRADMASLPLVLEFAKDGRVLRIIENIAELQAESKTLCHINIVPDADGVVRWNQILISHGGGIYPSLGLVGAMAALGVQDFSISDGHIVVGTKRIPFTAFSEEELRGLINYTGPEGLYKRVSFSDVITGAIGKKELQDKVLFVGATALGIYDLRVTPFSNNMPGVEINANVADSILRGDFIKAGAQEALLDIVFVLLMSFIVSMVTFGIRASIAVPFVVTLVVGYFGLSYMFFLHGRWLSVIYPVLGAVLSFPASASLRFFAVERRAKEIRLMFSSYVSPKVVDELIRHPETAQVGGQRRELTVMFVDVQGYTAFSERHSPEEVVKTLNEFLASMTEIIMAHDGTLDKFLGDGILAFWGAPAKQPDHAQMAVRCALSMIPRMDALRQKWLSEGREALDFGIGLSTGEAIVGNIGVTGKKIEYTAIGDTVNTAHRLQMLSRNAKTPVISEALYEKVKDIVHADCLGEVAVRGRHSTIKIYAVKGLKKSEVDRHLLDEIR